MVSDVADHLHVVTYTLHLWIIGHGDFLSLLFLIFFVIFDLKHNISNAQQVYITTLCTNVTLYLSYTFASIFITPSPLNHMAKNIPSNVLHSVSAKKEHIIFFLLKRGYHFKELTTSCNPNTVNKISFLQE